MLSPGDVLGHRFEVNGEMLSSAFYAHASEEISTEEHFSWTPGPHAAFEITRAIDSNTFIAIHIVSEYVPSDSSATDFEGDGHDEILRLYGANEYLVQSFEKRNVPVADFVCWIDLWLDLPPHQHVVRLYNVFETPHHVFLVLENVVKRGVMPLSLFLKQRERFTPDARIAQVIEILVQLCDTFVSCPDLQLCPRIDLDDFIVSMSDSGEPDKFSIKLFSLDVLVERDRQRESTVICDLHDRLAKEAYLRSPRANSFLNTLSSSSISTLSRLLYRMFQPIFAPWLSVMDAPPPPPPFQHECEPRMNLVQTLAKDVLWGMRLYFKMCFNHFGRKIGKSELALWKTLAENTFAVIKLKTPYVPTQHSPLAAPSKPLKGSPFVRINAVQLQVVTDNIGHILDEIDVQGRPYEMAGFLNAHMDMILELQDDVRRLVQKLIRKLYEKSGRYPEGMDYQVSSLLNTDACHVGGYADVYRAVDSHGAPSVALKKLRVLSGSNPLKTRKCFDREVLVMHMLGLQKHPNVIPFLGLETHHWANSLPCIVTPWMKNGTVMTYLETRITTISKEDMRSMFRGISAGLKFLHDEEVVHGDLCGRNILVDDDGNPRLADFGLSWFMGTTKKTTNSSSGSLRWMSPELLDYKITFERTYASDMYALGCTFWEISTGKSPFYEYPNDYAVILQITKGLLPDRVAKGADKFWRELADWQWEIIESCWQFHAEDRLDIGRVVELLDRDDDE